ncbi:hypothetical protein [Pseudomonas sp. FEN]|uniref:hypothetical protein n=1 Tax=Pseudomonas sp. FEN TaxID=2767468 RepID=UPI001749A9A4|nr:hypothetical protein [Pseudomonas sp. FEN]
MSHASPNLKTWMPLGRMSNLPTVWTNSLAAASVLGLSRLIDQPLGSLICVLVFFLFPHFQRWVKPT